MKGIKNRVLSGILATAVSMAFLLTACGAASSFSGNTAGDMRPMAASSTAMASPNYFAMDEAVAEEEMSIATADRADGIETAALASQRKIIKNASLSMETMEYDGAYQVIEEITEGMGGYIESPPVEGVSLYDQKHGYQSNRYASFTARVPADRLTAYIDALAEEFNVTNKSESGTDITDQYYDTQARLENLKIQEKRLLELLEQAGQLADLLEIERELADVRYEIETITASIKRMDSQVSYSTVNIQLSEVIEYQENTPAPRTFGDRLKDALKGSAENFLDFCEDLLFALIYAAPVLLLLLVIVIVVVMIIKALHKKHIRKTPSSSGWQAPQEKAGTTEKEHKDEP